MFQEKSLEKVMAAAGSFEAVVKVFGKSIAALDSCAAELPPGSPTRVTTPL
jgi:hypothetical protein